MILQKVTVEDGSHVSEHNGLAREYILTSVSVIQFNELAMKKSLKYLKLIFVCIVSGG